ncbi:MAG: hypothetical protein J7K73_00760 [Nanoarchaeota archaeon]|nr:hypothetical protein [Nanoarchaeota archaeon]
MSLEGIESQLSKNIAVLEQIFAKHEKFLEKLGSAIAKYVEVADIAKPLVEAAGAEIESKGRASKRTVYGRAGMFKGKRGKGLVQYLGEKSWALSTLIRLVGVERAEASEQARYLYATLREINLEEKAEEAEEKKLPKKLKARIKKVEKLTKECEKILNKEAARDKKLIRITAKEIAALNNAYHLSMKEGIFARRLVRFIGAARALKRLDILFQKEEIFFAKFMKEENWIVDDIAKDLKGIFKLIKDNEKIEKLIKGSAAKFKGEEKQAKKEEKVSKRIKKLMKSLERIQKHLAKVKKGAAKYGIKVEKSVAMLDAEEKALLKEEKEEEKELSDIEKLFENMQRFSLMISRFENAISIAEVRLEPQIKWINTALISAYKISKKNPAGVTSFLGKVGNFAERALVPALKHIDTERRELFKEFIGEEGIIKSLEKDMNMMYQLENKGFVNELKKMEKSLVQIEKNVVAGNKKAIADLKRDIAELKRSLKEEKEIVKEESQAGAPKTAGEEAETRAKIAELNKRILELKSKFRDMKKEFDPAVKKFKQAIKDAPHFKFAKKGLFGIFGKNIEDRMIKDIEMAEHYLRAEEGEDSRELQALRAWLSNVAEIENYVKFVEAAFKSFVDEDKMLKKMIFFYKDIALFEKDFSMEVRKAERTMTDLEVAVRDLEEVMNRHTDMFGEEERELFTELREIYNNSMILLNELKKTENALKVFAHNLPQMMGASKRAEGHIKEIEKLLKESEKNAKKLKKITGKEIQAKL